MRFRFITTGVSGKEKGWTLSGTAIESWQAIYRDQIEGPHLATVLQAIVGFLRSCKLPHNFSAELWEDLQNATAKEYEFLEIIRSFEWSLGTSENLELENEIKRTLLQAAHASDISSAQSLFERLFLYAFKRITQKGIKRLTKQELLEQLAAPGLSSSDDSLLVFLKDLRGLALKVRMLEQQSEKQGALLNSLSLSVETLGNAVRVQPTLSLPNPSLDAPTRCSPAVDRALAVDQIVQDLRSKTWVHVVGEPGSGKTQLCLSATAKTGRKTVWLNLRGYGPEQACRSIDSAIQALSGVQQHLLLRDWYDEALSRISSNTLLTLDDIPKVSIGGELWRRLDAICGACLKRGHRLLSAGYFELPLQTEESFELTGLHAPNFAKEEVLQLFAAHNAPAEFPASQCADLILQVTLGLPVLTAAAIRFVKSKNWRFNDTSLMTLFSGEFARGIKGDTRQMIQSTIEDDLTRELLYRLTCVIGPISTKQIETLCRVSPQIRLCLEKLNHLVGLWVQPYSEGSYRLSPLVESSLSNLLDSKTRHGVHAALGLLIVAKKTLPPLEIFTCINHFQNASLPGPAAQILSQALLELVQMDQEVDFEQLLTTVWFGTPFPKVLDLNIRLNVRALQISLTAKRGKDVSDLLLDFDSLMNEAKDRPDAQIGIFMACSYLMLQLARRHTVKANHFGLAALRSARIAVLPDGSKPAIPDEMSIENFFWVTANRAASNEDVEDWLQTISQLDATQLEILGRSELAADNAVALCERVWLREYWKNEADRDWSRCENLLRAIQSTAEKLKVTILATAAARSRMVVMAEAKGRLNDALAFALQQSERVDSDDSRFLLWEVVGRQLAYVNRWAEALEWIDRALKLNVAGFSILKRNLLITAGEGVGIQDPGRATEFTQRAVELSKNAQLASLRVSQALGEHSVALWFAGHAQDSFVVWQEALTILIEARDNEPMWTQAFLTFLHIAGYLSGMSLWGLAPRPDYVKPTVGMFLALDNMPVERYQPLQDGLLFLRTAIFAEATGHTSDAARWAKRAFSEARRQTGADMLLSFLWMPIPDAILRDNYAEALQQAFEMSVLKPPVPASAATFEVKPEEQGKLELMYTPTKMLERAFLFGLVPMAFRLATQRFDQDVSSEVESMVKLTEHAPAQVRNDWEKAGEIFERTFLNETSWQDCLADVDRFYSEGQIAFGILSLVNSLDGAPIKQSLTNQVRLAKDLTACFKNSPSVYCKIVTPFFVRFWRNAIESESIIFRTSAAYTRKSYEEALKEPIGLRLKKILSSMVVCVGLPLPNDLRLWLASDGSNGSEKENV